MGERIKGHIKWFSRMKRYGFIQCENGTNDVFVHANEFQSRDDVLWLKEGDPVEFEVEETPKGPSAVEVVVVSAE
jgi:CspA family cold shock protein